MKSDLIKKDQKFVVQSNALVEAFYRITLQEKRLVLWLITKISPYDEDFKKYKLNIIEFAQMVSLHPKTQYKEMRQITKSLMKRILEIREKDKNEICQMSWLCFARWSPKKGTCFLEFHPELKPHLLQLKGEFTKIGFDEFLHLRSVYSIRMFELLMQHELFGKRKMSVNELRDYFGIEVNLYPDYHDFKKRALERARLEISKKTNYEIDYEEVKEGRKVTDIIWTIQKKTHFEKAQAEKAAIITKELRSQHAILEQLIEYGFSKQGASRVLKTNPETDVANAIKAVDIQVQRGHVKNAKAMLAVAIKEKWHPEKYKAKKKAA